MTNENENVVSQPKTKRVKKETKKQKRERVLPEIQQRLGVQIREVLNEKSEIRWVITGNTKSLKELLKKHGLYFHATPYTPDVARAGITDPHWETDRPMKFDALLDDLVNSDKVAKVVADHEVAEAQRVAAENLLKTFVETAPGEVTMPWGKHQGEKLSEIPLDYVEWLASNFETKEPLKTAAKKVAETRKVKAAEKLQAKPAGEVVINFGKHSGKKLSEIPLDYVEWLAREAQSEIIRQKAREWVAQSQAAAPTTTTLYNAPPPNVPSPAKDLSSIALEFGRVAKADVKPFPFTRNLGFGKRKEAMEDAPKVGDLIQHKKFGPLVVVSVGEPRYFTSEMLEDFDMFDDEPGWQIHYTAIAVERTPTELAAYEAEIARVARKKAAQEILESAWKDADRPADPQVTGEYYRVLVPRTGIYSRTSYRLPAEGQPIWRIQENGADGDDWRPNNYGGCIADCVPFSAELAAAIRVVGELLK